MYKFLKFIRDWNNHLARIKMDVRYWWKIKRFQLKHGRMPKPEEWMEATETKFFEGDDGTEFIAFKTICAFGVFMDDMQWDDDVWFKYLPFMSGMAAWNLGGEDYDLSLHKLYHRVTNSRYPIRRGLAYEYIYGNASSVRRIAFRKEIRDAIHGDRYKNEAVDCYVKA